MKRRRFLGSVVAALAPLPSAAAPGYRFSAVPIWTSQKRDIVGAYFGGAFGAALGGAVGGCSGGSLDGPKP